MLRGARAPFALRRMASARLLIGALLLAILLAAVATAALASFGARALPAAAHQPLGALQQTTIGVVGPVGPRQATFGAGGLFRPLDPAGPYWQLSLLGTAGRLVQGTFVTYGPVLVSPAALADGRLSVEEASWLASPDLSRAATGSLGTLANRLGAAVASLQNDQSLGGLQVTTGLPELLSALASSLVVSRSLLVIGSLQLLLIAATAVALGARLLASHREPKPALLAARGMARGQLAQPALTGAGLLARAAPRAGALRAGWLSGMLLRASGLATASPFAGRLSSWPVSVWASAAAIAILAVAVIIWPVFRPAVPGAALTRRGRQAVLAGAAQAGLDGALPALGLLAFWPLRK